MLHDRPARVARNSSPGTSTVRSPGRLSPALL